MRRESEPGLGWVLDMQMGASLEPHATTSVSMNRLLLSDGYDRCSAGEANLVAPLVFRMEDVHEGCLPDSYGSVLRGGACPRPPAGMEAPPPQLSAPDARVVGSAPVRVAADGYTMPTDKKRWAYVG